MNKEQNKEIVTAISLMNAIELYGLLDDENSYMGVPLDCFVDKLADVFDDFRSAGDDYLEVYEGRCGALSRE